MTGAESAGSTTPARTPIPGWKRVLKLIGLNLIAAYLVYAVALFAWQRDLVFPGANLGAPSAEPPGDTEVTRIAALDAEVDAWLLLPRGAMEPSAAIVFVHGNGELIDDFATLAFPARELGYAVLLVEYPGYGRSTGETTRETLMATHEAAYDWLIERDDIDADRVAFFGRSMGGAIACDLASRRPSSHLIVMSTFTHLSWFAADLWLPPFLVRDRFACIDVLGTYERPVMVFHGRRDEMIPFEHGERLSEAAHDATFLSMNCAHNDCPPDRREMWRTVDAFLRGQ